MATLLHYLPYILGAAIALLILVCLFDDSGAKKKQAERQPQQEYFRRDRTPVQ